MCKRLITAYAAEKMLSAAYTVIKTGINEKGNYTMKTYLFCTTATMKEYNSRKWWIDSKIVRDMEIQAENVLSALNIWRARVSSVDISANAIKNRDPMFCDFKDGSTRQVGYVITASTDFETDNYKWSKQYIDLWVTIKEIAFCDFEETA